VKISCGIALLVFSEHDRIAYVMVADDSEESHLQPAEKVVHLFVFGVEPRQILRATVYQVAHAHDELWLEKVQFFKGIREHPTPAPSVTIAHYGKLEFVRVCLEFLIRPRSG